MDIAPSRAGDIRPRVESAFRSATVYAGYRHSAGEGDSVATAERTGSQRSSRLPLRTGPRRVQVLSHFRPRQPPAPDGTCPERGVEDPTLRERGWKSPSVITGFSQVPWVGCGSIRPAAASRSTAAVHDFWRGSAPPIAPERVTSGASLATAWNLPLAVGRRPETCTRPPLPHLAGKGAPACVRDSERPDLPP